MEQVPIRIWREKKGNKWVITVTGVTSGMVVHGNDGDNMEVE